MITDKKFTPEEYKEAIQKLGQGLADKVEGAQVRIFQDPLMMNRSIIEITKEHQCGRWNIWRLPNGEVVTERVLGTL